MLFDPVKGGSPFLQTESARQLINVALSRAKARLVVFLSPEDRKNPLLRKLADFIELVDINDQPVPISQFASESDFPDCALEQIVQIGEVIGKVVEVDSYAGKVALIDTKTGQRRLFQTAGIIEHYGQLALAVPVSGPSTEPLSSRSFQKATHLKDKASKIMDSPSVYCWTPLERKEVRASLGISGLGDAALARQLLQALNRED